MFETGLRWIRTAQEGGGEEGGGLMYSFVQAQNNLWNIRASRIFRPLSLALETIHGRFYTRSKALHYVDLKTSQEEEWY